MLTFRDDDVKDAIMADTGLRPIFALEAFGDLEGGVRQSIARIQASPFIPNKGRCAWVRVRLRDGEVERSAPVGRVVGAQPC